MHNMKNQTDAMKANSLDWFLATRFDYVIEIMKDEGQLIYDELRRRFPPLNPPTTSR
jgi:hypothetical protein